jgi:predicted permease
VVSLFLLETLLLSGAGGLGGLLVATGLGRLVALFYPSATPLELPMDFTVVGYGFLLALVTGLLVGGIPGLQASRRGLVPALQEARRPRLLGGLVVVQGALSFVLLLCTGLLVQSLGTFHKVGGTDPETVATLRLRPRLVGYTPAQAQGFLHRVTARLEALPGVEAVTLSAGLPPFPFFNPVPVHRADEAAATDADGAVVGRPPAYRDEISPGLFATLGIPLLGGRDFEERDGPETPPVVIVNQALARMLWPDHPAGEAALGETLRVGTQSLQVVGVVQDAAYRNSEESALPQLYTPYWQNPANVDARLLVRAARQGEAAALLPALRREIAALDPNVPVTEVETLSSRLERTFAPVYLAGRVLTVSGGLALFLSAVGLYSILALAVAQRTREIGIRMALGGRRAHLMGLVFRDLVRLTGLALALGLVAAVAVTGRLTHYLYGVGPHDPATFGAAVVALVLIATLAGWWPAHRASRVEPWIVLRQG